MAFNIEEFKSRGLPGGGARPTQFLVEMFPPPALGINGAEKIKFVCRAASIPPAIIMPIEVGYFGRPVKYAGDRQFPDWNVTVLNDTDFFVRKVMERWSTSMNTLISNVMKPEVFPTGYKTNAEVTQFRSDGEVIATYIFEGLFPTQVDAIPLDWEAMNQIETFDITFSYDYWLVKSGLNLSRGSTEGTAAEEIAIP